MPAALRRRPSPALVLALVALALGTAGIASGAFVGPGGTIKGCVASNGVLRVIDESAQCRVTRSPETTITLADGASFYTKTASDLRYAAAADLAALEARADALETDVGSLQSQVTTLTGTTVPGLQAAIAALDTRTDSLETSVTSLQGDVAGLEGQMTTLTGTTIPSLQAAVTSLDLRTDVLEASVTTLQGQVTTLQTQVTSLTATVNAICGMAIITVC